VHSSNKSSRRHGSNRVSGSLKGVVGVAPLNGGPGSIPSFIEMRPVVYEYQICLKCHSTYAGIPFSGATDMGIVFNPANPSYHPVEGRARDRGVKGSTFTNGWTADSTMYCSDCHSGSGAAHDSNYPSLLAAAFGESAAHGHENDLCYECHKKGVYAGDRPGSRFTGKGGHQGHAGRRIACDQCHEVHGSCFTEHLIKITPLSEGSGTVAFSHDRNGGVCVSSCHKHPDEKRTYHHAY
jgi:hypothetical protein